METAKITPEDHYNILSNEVVECIFCNTFVNLHNIKKHLKGKKCLELKALYLEAHKNKESVEANFKLYLNKLRKKVLRGET